MPNTVIPNLSVGILYASTIVGYVPGGSGSIGGFVSTANLAGLVSTSYLDSQLGSTIIGLGSAGYLSTGFSSLIASSFSSSNASFQLLTMSSLTFGTGSGYLTLPNTVIPNLSVGILYASTIVGYNPGGGASIGDLVSTSTLLVNTISSGQIFTSSIRAQIVSSILVQAGTIGVIGNTTFYGDGTYLQNLTAANVTGTLPYTAYGTGSIPLGSINPVGDINIIGNLSSINASFQNITTSTIVFGTKSGYLTLPNTVIPNLSVGILYASTIVGYVPGGSGNIGGFVSTANLAGLVSTSYLDSQVGSTVIGLGSAGYLSTGFSSLIASSFSSSNASFQLLTMSSITFGTGSGYLTLPNTVIPSLSVGILYASTIVGYNPGGGGSIGDFISTANLAGLVSTSYLDSQLTSTVIGLGSAGYLSTGFSSLIASSFSSSNASFQLLTTSSILFGTTSGYLTLPNTVIPNLSVGILYASTIVGYNPGGASIGGLVSTSYLDTQLTSTVIGLGTVGYLSSIPGGGSIIGGLVSTANLANMVSTSYLTTQLTELALTNRAYWVVVGSIYSGNNSIKYSYNGRDWLATTGVNYLVARGIAFNGSYWIAVGASSNIIYSSDGQHWYNTTKVFDGYGVAWNGSYWVVVGNPLFGYYHIIYSSDGQNWYDSTTLNDAIGIAWNGSYWVAIGTDIIYSYDAKIWSNSSSGGFAASGIAWNGSYWVAVGTYYIKYSYDGQNWLNSSSGGFAARGIAWNGSYWVAVGTGSGVTTIKHSYDGKNWSNSSTGGFTSQGDSIAWNGSYWIAGGEDTGNSMIQYSYDGINWLNSSSGITEDDQSINSIAWSQPLYSPTQFNGDTYTYTITGNLIVTSTLNVGTLHAANLVNLVSTANLTNLISTSFLNTQLTSTVIGLGTAGYISTLYNVTFISSVQAQASSFSGNLADAFTLIMADM